MTFYIFGHPKFRHYIQFNDYNFVCVYEQTIGDGNSKKVAKKHAAENMLNELHKLPPLRVAGDLQGNGRRKNFAVKRNASSNSRQQVQQINDRRKGATLVKEINTSVLGSTETANDVNEVANPVAALIRLQQVSKKNEPIYNMVEERGQGRRKEFVMEVICSGMTVRGMGGNKRDAKRNAAKNILAQMGYNENGIVDGTISQNVNITDKNRKVTFSEARVYNENAVQSVGGASGRQLVPGLLLMKNQENNRSKSRFWNQ